MDLNAIHILVKVVESRSFTQAAIALDMTKSTVSRKLADLEQALGVRLITRSTRSLPTASRLRRGRCVSMSSAWGMRMPNTT